MRGGYTFSASGDVCCPHGEAKLMTSKTPKNPGRQYWKCAQGKDTCLFVWIDEMNGSQASSQASPSSSPTKLGAPSSSSKSPAASPTKSGMYNPTGFFWSPYQNSALPMTPTSNKRPREAAESSGMDGKRQRIDDITSALTQSQSQSESPSPSQRPSQRARALAASQMRSQSQLQSGSMNDGGSRRENGGLSQVDSQDSQDVFMMQQAQLPSEDEYDDDPFNDAILPPGLSQGLGSQVSRQSQKEPLFSSPSPSSRPIMVKEEPSSPSPARRRPPPRSARMGRSTSLSDLLPKATDASHSDSEEEQDVDDILSPVRDHMQRLRARCTLGASEIDKLKAQVEELSRENRSLKDDNRSLEDLNRSLKDEIFQMNQAAEVVIPSKGDGGSVDTDEVKKLKDENAALKHDLEREKRSVGIFQDLLAKR